MKKWLYLLLCACLLAACTTPIENETLKPTASFLPTTLPAPSLVSSATSSPPTLSPTSTRPAPLPGSATPSPEMSSPTSTTPASTPTLGPKAWRMLPVLPATVSQRMHAVYELGRSLGNDPHAFSKVGDCQSTLPLYLADYDKGRYNLGDYTDLQPVIDYFSGSFARDSLAVKDGLTASAVIAKLWNDFKDCEANESRLECEYRLHRPSFAIISFGTNDANGIRDANGNLYFEASLKQVIEITLAHGIVPILATKADNIEGDQSINETIARFAYEYEIPLWNFWQAVQELPNQGLDLPDRPEHLTVAPYAWPTYFNDPEYLQYAWTVRNLTALQALDIVWRLITGLETP